jgi:hypothetical protein
MASVYKPVGGSGKESKYWHACFYVPGAEGLAVLMRKTTKQRDRRLALEVAVQWERAGKTAGEGRLTQQKAREVLQGIMKNVGTEKLEEHTVEGWLRSWLANTTGCTLLGLLASTNGAGWAFGLGLERLAMVRTDPSIAA